MKNKHYTDTTLTLLNEFRIYPNDWHNYLRVDVKIFKSFSTSIVFD